MASEVKYPELGDLVGKEFRGTLSFEKPGHITPDFRFKFLEIPGNEFVASFAESTGGYFGVKGDIRKNSEKRWIILFKKLQNQHNENPNDIYTFDGLIEQKKSGLLVVEKGNVTKYVFGEIPYGRGKVGYMPITGGTFDLEEIAA